MRRGLLAVLLAGCSALPSWRTEQYTTGEMVTRFYEGRISQYKVLVADSANKDDTAGYTIVEFTTIQHALENHIRITRGFQEGEEDAGHHWHVEVEDAKGELLCVDGDFPKQNIPAELICKAERLQKYEDLEHQVLAQTGISRIYHKKR
jgi:hypothetical protein